MLKNPYLLPLIALIFVGVLFVVQKKQLAVVDADLSKVSSAGKRRVLLASFRDPTDEYSVSGWDVGTEGLYSKTFSKFPKGGFIEFDFTVSNGSEGTIINARGLPLSISINPSIDTLIFVSAETEIKRYIKIPKASYVRVLIEWNNSLVSICVNGREMVQLPLKEPSVEGSIFIRHNNKGNGSFEVSDFRLYSLVE